MMNFKKSRIVLSVGTFLSILIITVITVLASPHLSAATWACGTGTVLDGAAHTYNTVSIGNQCWMATNMDYDLNSCTTATYVDFTDVGSCSYYPAQSPTRGMLYQYSVAANSNLCPVGWHLPSDTEFMTLEEYLGMCAGTGVGCSDTISARGDTQGTQLKSGGTSGFNFLMGGYRYEASSLGTYLRGQTALDSSSRGYLWSSTPFNATSSYSRIVFNSGASIAKVDRSIYDNARSFNVRCLKDTTTTISSAANQTFVVGDAATAISVITITNASSTPSITAANDIRIKIPATFNMTWDTTDTTATIGGTDAAKVSTISYPDSKTLLINVDTDFDVNSTLTIQNLSFNNFSNTSSASDLQLVIGGSSGTISATDDKTIAVSGPSTTVATSTAAPTYFQSDATGQYFGTFKMTGTGSMTGLTLTQYGTASSTVDLTNVKLIKDDGDGAWNATSDTVQLGSTTNFNSSNSASFSGFSLASGASSYVHVISDVSSKVLPLPAATIGIEILQAGDITSNASITTNYPLQLGTSTLSTIFPYLQNATTTAIDISWSSATSSSAGGSVSYGITTAYGSTVSESITPLSVVVASSTYKHRIALTGLIANTTYHYKVTDTLGLVSTDSTFKTAPVDGTPFSFLVMGDLGGNLDSPASAFFSIAGNVAESMVLNNPQTIALQMGDHQNDGYDYEWQSQFFLPERNILKNTVLYNAYGNHDTKSTLGRNAPTMYAAYFDPPTVGGSSSELYYSFNYGNVHFIVLDGNASRANPSAQYTWLKTDMASAAAQNADFRVISTHQPGLAYGGGHASADDNGFMAAVTSLGSEAGVTKNVDLVFMGHNHVYERNYKPEGTRGGITWITADTVGGDTDYDPTACAPGTGSCPYLQYTGPKGYGYLVISTTHQSMTGTYYYTDNVGGVGLTPTVNDTFTIPTDTSVPTNVGISSITAASTQLTVLANTAADSGVGLNANPYQFAETSGNSGGSSSDWQAGTTFVDTGLTPNTQYSYKVRAKDVSDNTSDYSATSSKYTLANIPATLTLTVDSVSRITASWLGNSNPSNITEYYIENTTAFTNSGWATTTSWISSGLTCGTSYTFGVIARNGENVDTATTTASATTSACSTGFPPADETTDSTPSPAVTTSTSHSGQFAPGRGPQPQQPQQLSSSPSYIFTTNFSPGKTSPEVKLLQIYLNNHGFTVANTGAGSPSNETNFFGSATKAALIRFQEANGIFPATGDFGPRTRALINGSSLPWTTVAPTTQSPSTSFSFTRDLASNMTGGDVKLLQIYLNNHGFTVANTGAGSPSHETNFFGSATKAALIRFQKYHGITPAIGYFGPLTRNFILLKAIN